MEFFRYFLHLLQLSFFLFYFFLFHFYFFFNSLVPCVFIFRSLARLLLCICFCRCVCVCVDVVHNLFATCLLVCHRLGLSIVTLSSSSYQWIKREEKNHEIYGFCALVDKEKTIRYINREELKRKRTTIFHSNFRDIHGS